MALSLAARGVRVEVLEAADHPTTHPQAHFIHQSSVEILDHLGLLPAILEAAPPVDEWHKFVYCRTLTDEPLAVTDHLTPADAAHLARVSPVSAVHLAQSKLVQILLRAARQHPLVNVRFGTRVRSVDDPAGGTAATVSLEAKGRGPSTLLAHYVIAADGAGSSLRTSSSIALEGSSKPLQHLINVHFRAPGLCEALATPAMLYFVYNKSVVSVVVAHDIHAGEFVCQIPYFPEFEPFESFTADKCRRLIAESIGGAGSACEVLSIRRWTMNLGVASTFSKGRVFLVGDAAHQFPPSGAFGMNTGLQDANNLAWKMADVLLHGSPPSLLATYEQERKPCAAATGELSMRNFNKVIKVSAELGANPEYADYALQVFDKTPLAFLPSSLKSSVLTKAFSLGRQQLASEESSFLSRVRRQGFTETMESGGALKLFFPGHDLGHTYGASAITTPSTAAGAGAAADRRGPGTDDEAAHAYVPCVTAGARLPHAWLRACGGGGEGEGATARQSTAHLVGSVGSAELLVVLWGDTATIEAWGQEMNRRVQQGFRLRTAAVHNQAPRQGHLAPGMHREVYTWCGGQQEGENDDCAPSFGEHGGAALVRPDNYIAWSALGPPDKGENAPLLDNLDATLGGLQGSAAPTHDHAIG